MRLASRRRVACAALVLGASAAFACGTGSGGDADLSSDAGATTDATSAYEAGIDAAPSDGATDAAPPDAPACAADLMADPHHCGRCGHDCVGGSCAGGQCQPIILATSHYPEGIAVDAQHVYWSAPYESVVMRADKDGSNVTVVVRNGKAAVAPAALALTDDAVYWGNDGSLTSGLAVVGRCAKSGCNGQGEIVVLASNTAAAVHAVSVDDAGVFWADGTRWEIGRAVPDGGGAGAIVTGLYEPNSVVARGDSVYFASADPLIGRIMQRTDPMDAGGTLHRSPFELLAQLDGGGPRGPDLAVDDTTVYFVHPALNELAAIPKDGITDGGAPTVLAAKLPSPMSIAADATNLYWINRGPLGGPDGGPYGYSDGSVMTCPKAGCGPSGPRVLAGGLQDVWSTGTKSIAVDDVAVYFTVFEAGLVMKVAK